jgi:tripartite-type tricarboxylate transporter receptor subunit TctC
MKIQKNIDRCLFEKLLFAMIFCLSVVNVNAAYPDRPIRLIIPYAAGGPTDILGRIIGEKMGEMLKQSIVIDNRQGAGANVGIMAVAKSPADGYTLLFGDINLVINPFLYKNLSFDVQRDFSSVGLVASAPLVLIVNQNSTYKNINDLVAYAKSKPGSLNYGSAGAGNTTHLAMELLKSKHGLDMTHVPYKGATPAINDLIAGHIDCMVVGLSAAKALIEGGKLRALAITGDKRAMNLPSVLTFDQAGFPLPEMKIGSWWGIVAPKGTPTEVIQELNNALNTSINSTEVKSKLRELNIEPLGGTSAEFDRWMGNEIETWSKVIKKANIQIEP